MKENNGQEPSSNMKAIKNRGTKGSEGVESTSMGSSLVLTLKRVGCGHCSDLRLLSSI